VIASLAGFLASSAAGAPEPAATASSNPGTMMDRGRSMTNQPLFMKIPFRFISSAWGLGENLSPSVLLIFPALISR
jgi:hypothetical protein